MLGPMDKGTPRLNSVHQIGVETPPLGILTVVDGCRKRGILNSENRKHF